MKSLQVNWLCIDDILAGRMVKNKTIADVSFLVWFADIMGWARRVQPSTCCTCFIVQEEEKDTENYKIAEENCSI